MGGKHRLTKAEARKLLDEIEESRRFIDSIEPVSLEELAEIESELPPAQPLSSEEKKRGDEFIKILLEEWGT